MTPPRKTNQKGSKHHCRLLIPEVGMDSCLTSAFQSSSVAVPSKDLTSMLPLSIRERRWSGVRWGDANRRQSSEVRSEKSRAREWREDKRSTSDGEMSGPTGRGKVVVTVSHGINDNDGTAVYLHEACARIGVDWNWDAKWLLKMNGEWKFWDLSENES